MAAPGIDGPTKIFWDKYSEYLHEKREESVKTNLMWAITCVIKELLKLHRALDFGLGEEKIHENATSVLMYITMVTRNMKEKFTMVYPDQADYNALIDCPPPSKILEHCAYLCLLMKTEMEMEGENPETLPDLHNWRWQGLLREILLLLAWYSGKSLQDLAYEHHRRMEPSLYVETQPSALLWDTSCKRLYKD